MFEVCLASGYSVYIYFVNNSFLYRIISKQNSHIPLLASDYKFNDFRNIYSSAKRQCHANNIVGSPNVRRTGIPRPQVPSVANTNTTQKTQHTEMLSIFLPSYNTTRRVRKN